MGTFIMVKFSILLQYIIIFTNANIKKRGEFSKGREVSFAKCI